MTQVGKICTALLASILMLLFGTVVLAEEMSTEVDAAVYEEPAVVDREATIEELVRHWGTDEQIAYQLRATLEYASDEKLTEAWDAESLDEIEGILLGKALDVDVPLTLNDTVQDYVFTPVTPCRVVDTRIAGGMIIGGTSREFYVYGGVGDIGPQGGNPLGCPSPVGEPLGVHVNITAVEQISVGGGHLRAYPANVAKPDASIVNFMNGQNAIANAASVKTFFSFGPKELEIYASANTHVIIDVMGYYERPERTLPDTYTVSAVTSVPANAYSNAFSPSCPTGYRLMSGGAHTPSTNLRMILSMANSFTTGANVGVLRWRCGYRNIGGSAINATCFGYCIRIPGR